MERKIDELGRLVIPMEFRRALGWTTGTRLRQQTCSKKNYFCEIIPSQYTVCAKNTQFIR